jgi:hypothetical protein
VKKGIYSPEGIREEMRGILGRLGKAENVYSHIHTALLAFSDLCERPFRQLSKPLLSHLSMDLSSIHQEMGTGTFRKDEAEELCRARSASGEQLSSGPALDSRNL